MGDSVSCEAGELVWMAIAGSSRTVPAPAWGSLLPGVLVVSCQSECNPQIRMKDIGLFFRGTFMGDKTRAGLPPPEEEHSVLVKTPQRGTRCLPKHLQVVCRAALNTRDLVTCFTTVKRCFLRTHMEHWSVVPVKRISSSWEYLGGWSISPLLPLASPAASVERIRFWSLWTCLSSEDRPPWEIVLSSMPLSTIRFRPGNVCVLVFSCYKRVQTCT